MNTAFRDAERTFADFYWDTGESRPGGRRQGLQVGLSRGYETDTGTGDITELVFAAAGWRVLNEPDKSRREAAQEKTRVDDHETRLAALESR